MTLDIFCSIHDFCFYQAFVMAWGVAFLEYLENYKEKTAWRNLYLVMLQVEGIKAFFWEFSNFPEQLWTTASELFNISLLLFVSACNA